MFFSIIIPVYNVEKYIDQCLESVVTQEFDSFEVIVVDDGSTDSSGIRCEVYAEKYANVRVVHQENKGLSEARNVGLDMAVGDWIVFADSDDWVVPGMLKKLFTQITEEDADLYSYNAYKTDEQGTVTEKLLFVPENDSLLFLDEKKKFEYFTEYLMQYKRGWEVWSRVFRRSIIEQKKLRFFDCAEIFAEDYLFTFQYLLYAKKIRHLCSVYYYYRQRKNSSMQSLDKRSVLVRLHQWSVTAYGIVKKRKMAYFKKHYEMIYFCLLNFHLQYMLSSLSQDELKSELQRLEEKKHHRQWVKQLRKYKDELRNEMRVIKWL